MAFNVLLKRGGRDDKSRSIQARATAENQQQQQQQQVDLAVPVESSCCNASELTQRGEQVPVGLDLVSSSVASAASEAKERAEMKRLVLSSTVEDGRLPKVFPVQACDMSCQPCRDSEC